MSEPVGNGPRTGPSGMPAIPNNSHKARAEAAPEARPEMQKVVTGKVITKKPSVWKRVTNSIIADDAKSVSDYIVEDVFVPALKNLLYDIVVGGTGRALFGGRIRPSSALGRGPVSTVMGGGIRTKYETMSEPPRNQLTQAERARHDFENLVLTRDDALLAISSLIARCAEYGAATVADLYNALGVTGSYADRGYGWTDLGDHNTDIRQTREGFVLNLPRPQPLR